MERTPRPEMGREWGRGWSVTGVSAPPFITFATRGQQLKKKLFSAKDNTTFCYDICACVYVIERDLES